MKRLDMRFIAHRGNIVGKDSSKENHPRYILGAIEKSYDVEIDLWVISGELYLGHDEESYTISKEFLLDSKDYLWVHAKNKEALEYADALNLNCFFHTNEKYVYTKHGRIWVYPGDELMAGSVAVLPETVVYRIEDLRLCYAICSDNIKKYKEIINEL